MQRVLREAVLPSQRSKGALTFLLLGARNGTCSLPGGIGPHAAQPSLPFRQDGVIELARGFQMGTQPLRLPRCHLERQFQEKGRRRLVRMRCFRCVGLPLLGHRGSPCCPDTRTYVLSIHQVPGAVKHETRPRLADLVPSSHPLERNGHSSLG